MTFTSILLAALAGIAFWQVIIFIGFLCGVEENDIFVDFITCFFTIPLLVFLPLIRKLIMFSFSNLYEKMTFHADEHIVTTAYIAKKNKKLFKTDVEDNYYVTFETFEKKEVKSLPLKSEIYHKGQKYCQNVKIDSYLKKRE